MSIGGSVKDRIGFRIIQDAEDKDTFKPDWTVIEQRSGTTGNPLAYYDQPANEVWILSEGKVDYAVAGVETGRTISEIGQRFKELSPQTKIMAVDLEGPSMVF